MRAAASSIARLHAVGAVLILGLVVDLCGCARSGDGSAAPSTTRQESTKKSAERIGGADSLAHEEREEAEEEARMRRRAAKSLSAYRAASCAEAVATIEGLLHRGAGRWLERGDTGGLPSDLAAALSEAELWAFQSEALCRNDPRAPRFEALRALMDAIWRYPRQASRADLEQQLRVLDD